MADFEYDALDAKEPEYEYAYPPDYARGAHYFGIGSTTPPKDHTAVVSVVLIILLSICGLLSALSLMDIDPFQQMQLEKPVKETGVPVRFSASTAKLPAGLEDPGSEQVPGSTAPAMYGAEGERMELHISGVPTRPLGTEPGDGIAPTEQAVLSWQDVYEKVIPSVVSIVCTDGYTTGSGTGVIMDVRGYIITNAHVVEGADVIQVILWDDRRVTAQCLGLDQISDLAVLHIQAEGLTAAEFGDSSVLRVGDEVVAIGDPLGVELRGTMTDGIISAINRGLEVNGRTMSLLQTTAALNNGNSGGPLVNCYGQVVGINTMKIGDYASTSGVEGLGFAIPMTTVKSVVEQLATAGYVAGRPSLGMEGQMLSAFYQHYYRLPAGMLIDYVDPQSDAYAKGIRDGDILLYVNDQRITSLEIYQNTVNGMEVDETVSVMVYRGGREYELNLTVGERKG